MKHQNSTKRIVFPVETEKRFGSIAVEKGFIKPNQLIGALKIQITEEVMTGKHTLLGEILLEQGLITPQQIKEVLQSQKESPSDPSKPNNLPF